MRAPVAGDAGEREHVLDHLAQAPALVADDASVHAHLLEALHDAVRQVLGRRLDDRDRRAQLVRHRGHELHLPLAEALRAHGREDHEQHGRDQQQQDPEGDRQVAPARGRHHLVERPRAVGDHQAPAPGVLSERSRGETRARLPLAALRPQLQDARLRVRPRLAPGLRRRAPHRAARTRAADDPHVLIQAGRSAEVALGERRQDASADRVEVEHRHHERRALRRRRAARRLAGVSPAPRQHHERRDLLDDRLDPAAPAGRGTEPGQQRAQLGRIRDAHERARGGVVAVEPRLGPRGVDEVHRLHQLGPGCRAPPGVVARGPGLERARAHLGAGHLQGAEGGRDRRVELAAHRLRARPGGGAQARVLGLAQGARPAVLQRGQHQEQHAERPHRDGNEGERPRRPPHADNVAPAADPPPARAQDPRPRCRPGRSRRSRPTRCRSASRSRTPGCPRRSRPRRWRWGSSRARRRRRCGARRR